MTPIHHAVFFFFFKKRSTPLGGCLDAQAHVCQKLAKMTTPGGDVGGGDVGWVDGSGPKGLNFFFIRFGSGGNFFLGPGGRNDDPGAWKSPPGPPGTPPPEIKIDALF